VAQVPLTASTAPAPADVLPSPLDRVDLDVLPWAHTSRTFQAGRHRFTVRSTHAGIGRFVDEVYGACAVPEGGAATCYSIVDGLPGGWPHALYVDGRRATQVVEPARILDHLTWHVNRQVIATRGDHLLIHAAAASLDGIGVVFPAAMEAGKTTLVAGLVQRGFSYLTDEAAAIDPIALEVHPYPKPLSIDPGSWSVLADLEPPVDEATAPYLATQWQVGPEAIRPGATSGPVPAPLVVFPRYEPDATTRLEPLRRSEALVAMLGQTFRFHDDGPRALEVLGRFLERADCYRLVNGDLDEACQAVIGLVGSVRGRAGWAGADVSATRLGRR
jgi:hypothetical protein